MHYVFGCGISGSAAVKLLKSFEIPVSLIDSKNNQNEIVEKFPDFSDIPIFSNLDQLHPERGDTLIPSPGIPLDHPVITTFREQNCEILSEVELGLRYFNGKVIAVTGTNGKSTTTAMCSHILNENSYRAVSAGNFGTPPCEIILKERQPDVLVLELSSYQLELIEEISADVIIFTSFSSDHLERHKTLEKYFDVKWSLVKKNPDIPLILSDQVIRYVDTRGINVKNTLTVFDNSNTINFNFNHIAKAKHNYLNGSMSLAACEIITGNKITQKTVEKFPGLEHRCELVINTKSIRVVNDSKSTNVDSTMTALQSFTEPLILIMGGIGKMESFESINNADQVRHIILFGQDRFRIATDLNPNIYIQCFEKLEQAVTKSITLLNDQIKTILFSPGCASFDQFQNFEKRGAEFKRIITGLLK